MSCSAVMGTRRPPRAFDYRYVALLRQGAALHQRSGDIDGGSGAVGGDGGREGLGEGDERAEGDGLVAEGGAVEGLVTVDGRVDGRRSGTA